MSIIDKFLIRLKSKKIGVDHLGNEYYESKQKDYLGKSRRLVICAGKQEPSKVPPMWHAWLHYLSDEIPSGQIQNFAWQREHECNHTGTKERYYPQRHKVAADYVPWKPGDIK